MLVEFSVGIPIVIVVAIRFYNRWVENDYEIMPSWNNSSLRHPDGLPGKYFKAKRERASRIWKAL